MQARVIFLDAVVHVVSVDCSTFVMHVIFGDCNAKGPVAREKVKRSSYQGVVEGVKIVAKSLVQSIKLNTFIAFEKLFRCREIWAC